MLGPTTVMQSLVLRLQGLRPTDESASTEVRTSQYSLFLCSGPNPSNLSLALCN